MVLTVPAVLALAVERFPNTEAIVTPNTRWTFAELGDRAHRAARAFVGAGLQVGDRVAIWAPNIPEWVEVALGVHLAGGAIVPLNTRFKAGEAHYIVERSGARFVVCVNDFLGNDYAGSLNAFGPLPKTVQAILSLGSGATSWADFLADAKDDTALPDVEESALSDVIYTSGTTGKPKGVVATHSQTIRVFTDWSKIVGLSRGDRYLIVNPFFHTFGYKAGILACLIRGATMVPEPIFDVPTILERIDTEAITALPGPPTLYISILNHPERERYDLSSLRLAVTGAAPVPVAMIERMRNELSFTTILTAYGLTESTGTVSMCRRDDDPETISTTSGRAIPGVEIRVADDDGGEVPVGEPGEIMVRGYNVTSGYLDDPAATEAAITEQGWLHTGDIGVMDQRGYIDVRDRKKDMFVVGGFNAYPAEIENMMLRHRDLTQVAVVGVPDARLGEVGHAFVVTSGDPSVDEASLIEWCREAMANYKVPRKIHFVSNLPTNASGKVLKFQLREQAKRLSASKT